MTGSLGGGGRGLVTTAYFKIINHEITIMLAVQILPTATASLSTTELLLHLITGGVAIRQNLVLIRYQVITIQVSATYAKTTNDL